MLAVLFLILCLCFGLSFLALCIPDIKRLFIACAPSKNIVTLVPPIVFTVPAGMVVGMILVSIGTYMATFACSQVVSSPDTCKRFGVLIAFIIFSGLTAANISYCIKRSEKTMSKAELARETLIPDFKNSTASIIYFGICTVIFTAIASWLMFYTYRIEGTELWAGYTVFSDLAPHTAMTSSFGVGFNFPTQYFHFAGDGIQYHFFFYYLCGTLEYLGFPIDWAINIPSIISMVCAFELMGLIAIFFSRRRLSFLIAPILVLFRSSFNVFYHISEITSQGSSFSAAIEEIKNSHYWYEKTPYDSWGIWAINVYPNQRHLMLGMSCILIFSIIMMPFVRRMCISILKAETTQDKINAFLLNKESWLPRKNDPLNPIGITVFACVLAMFMPFIHGSALIGGLLVLFGMAVFSESRLNYLAIAITAVVSSYIQTGLFSGAASNVVKFQRQAGFVAEDKTPAGVIEYIVIVTGLTLIIAIIYAVYMLIRDIIKKKPAYRSIMLICFLLPFIFAFNFQVSLEMLANHKFIQFSLILCDIYVAGALAELFHLPLKHKEKELSDAENKRRLSMPAYIAIQACTIVLGLALIIPLTATGWSEWCTYYNINKDHSIVRTDSQLIEWVINNTDESDVFLTPEWSLNRFFLAGRPTYYGWPYYAWSAGHDTYLRDEVYCWLISGCNNNPDEFRRYCRERGIKYVIATNDYYDFNYGIGPGYNPEFFANNLPQVAYFPEEDTIVYQAY